MYLRELEWEGVAGLVCLRTGKVADCSERSGFMKCEEILE
jgi:hypothetical protein